MNKSKLLAIGAELALIATTVLNLALHDWWVALASLALAAAAVFFVGQLTHTSRRQAELMPTVGVGTVRTVDTDESETADGDREIWIEVSSVQGDTFIGRLVHDDGDADLSLLRPGLVVLVAFDPAAREQLSLPDDVLAVRAQSLSFA